MRSIRTVREERSEPDLSSGVSDAKEFRMIAFSRICNWSSNDLEESAGSRNPTFALGSAELIMEGVPSMFV